MTLRHKMPAAVVVTVAILAGCGGGGGGGGSDTAVSATPPAANPAPTTPEPPAAPAPTTPVVTAPVPQPAPSPGATPPAATPDSTVPGTLVLGAISTGISEDSARATDPYSSARILRADDGSTIELAGGTRGRQTPDTMHTYVITDGFPSASGIGLADSVAVKPQIVNGVIVSVDANGLPYQGPGLTLGSGAVTLDSSPATWTRGEYSVSLVVTRIGERPEMMRVCWNVHLPPPPAVTGPPGYQAPEKLARTDPLKRLMCGEYGRNAASDDVGGYVIDDRNGVTTTYRGIW